MKSARFMVAAAFFATAALLAASVPAAAETITIEIRDLEFRPSKVTAKIGDTIAWVNHDAFAHTATARNGDWNVMQPPRKTVTSTVTKTGEVVYFCRFHPNMTGTLTVTP